MTSLSAVCLLEEMASPAFPIGMLLGAVLALVVVKFCSRKSAAPMPQQVAIAPAGAAADEDDGNNDPVLVEPAPAAAPAGAIDLN